MTNNKRAEEFLKCLGNGKGRVTEEDENPEEYERRMVKVEKEVFGELRDDLIKGATPGAVVTKK